MNAKSLAETLSIQIGHAHWVVNATLEGIDDDAYYHQIQDAGNCLNWVLGHMVQARNGALVMLGQEPVMPVEIIDRYKRSSDAVTNPAGTISPAELRDAFNRAQEPLLAGLASLKDEMLTEKAPFSPGDSDKETVGSLLAGLAFHEAYHCGQLGLIRRTLGMDGVIK